MLSKQNLGAVFNECNTSEILVYIIRLLIKLQVFVWVLKLFLSVRCESFHMIVYFFFNGTSLCNFSHLTQVSVSFLQIIYV